MEETTDPAHVLLQCPWLPVSISGCQLLAKTWFGDLSYHVVLADMTCVWEERMDSVGIQTRSRRLNRRVRAPVNAIFSHLREAVQPRLTCSASGRQQTEDEAPMTLQRQEDGSVVMKLKSELAGLPFYWDFNCTPAPVTVACVQLVRPLLTMSRLLQRQVEQLESLLMRKDAEIQDYRENGATLSRDRLQTEVFQEETHRKDFMAKVFPLLISEKQNLGFTSVLQQLYVNVIAHGNSHTPKRKPSEDDGDGPGDAEEPPSLVGNETVEEDERQSRGAQREVGGATEAEGTTAEQSVAVRSDPADRPASKPKRKKVGLFR